MERRRVDGRAARTRPLDGSADVDLRSPPRIVGARAGGSGPVPDVSRAGRSTRTVRERSRLHAHRAAPGDGASVFWIVGLPGPRILRADVALRSAGGLQTVRRS